MTQEYNRTDENGRANPEQTCQFWRNIYGNERGYLCIASANRNGDELTGMRQTFYPYPSQAKAAAAHTLKESERGREVYQTAHLLKERTNRKKGNATRIRSLWADFDGAPVPEDPEPTALLETSPGRWHGYFRLTESIDPVRAEDLNKRLAYAFGADKGKWAQTTLLRPPQTTNYKRDEPFTVAISSLDARREYDPDELDRLLPPLEGSNGHTKSSYAADEPPVRLGPAALRIWRGEQVVEKETGEVDRSSSLYKLGAVLADAGASKWVVAEALEERDRSLGWHKYTDRADGPMQYTNIAEKVASGEASFDAPDDKSPSYNMTDLGNAERLVAHHGKDLRYCHPWGKWLAWNGKRWAVDAAGEVERRAVEIVKGIYAEAKAATDSDDRRRIARHAMSSESRSRIEAMMALARAMPGIPVLPNELDTDPWLLNCENGTIDLRTGDRRLHRREDLITKMAPVEYDPSAKAPIFERFLVRILPQEAVRGFLKRAVGYAASGVIREEVLPILHGPGANGKTTLTGVLMEGLGDYAIQAAPDLLMLKKGAHPTELADLYGARFVVCMENEEGRRLAESLVKYITGRERIKARRMREDFWEFAPTHTVFLGTNHRPEVRGTDHAIWRRLKLIPFDVTIPEAEQDKALPETLRSELPGILAWIVRGCIEYQRVGLGEPEQVKDATKGYRSDMDPLEAFIDECCVVGQDVWCKFANLYSAYTHWCEESNEHQIKKRRFADRLTERGYERGVGTDGVKIRKGIALRHDGDPVPTRMTDPAPDTRPDQHEGTPKVGEAGNSGDEELPIGNSQKTCKNGGVDDRITDHYRESHINNQNLSHEGLYEKVGNGQSFGNSGPTKSNNRENPVNRVKPVTSNSDDPTEGLTDKQARDVLGLVRQGMLERFAIAEVLGRN